MPENPQSGPIELLDTHYAALIADWLSGLFLEPLRAEALESLLGAPATDLLDEIGDLLECRAATRQMGIALLAAPPDDVARHLERRYTTLFVGVAGRHHTVSLYESTYSGRAGRLFQRPFDEMREILRRLDVSIQQGCREPADHVSVELAALSAAIRADDADVAKALVQRLAAWIPQFQVRIDRADPGGFYSGVATVLAEFLASVSRRWLPVSCDQYNRLRIG